MGKISRIGGRIKAVIFDLDGVLVNTEPLHRRAWNMLFEEKGIKVADEQFFKNTVGTTDLPLLERIFSENNISADPAIWLRMKEERYWELLKDGIAVFPGARTLLKELNKLYPLGLASNAWLKSIYMILDRLKWRDYFKVIVGREDARRHKPDPQIYLIAARRLNLAPERCLAIEDSVVGVSAAKRAGMICIAVTNSFSQEELSEADIVLTSIEDTHRIIQLITAF